MAPRWKNKPTGRPLGSGLSDGMKRAVGLAMERGFYAEGLLRLVDISLPTTRARDVIQKLTRDYKWDVYRLGRALLAVKPEWCGNAEELRGIMSQLRSSGVVRWRYARYERLRLITTEFRKECQKRMKKHDILVNRYHRRLAAERREHQEVLMREKLALGESDVLWQAVHRMVRATGGNYGYRPECLP